MKPANIVLGVAVSLFSGFYLGFSGCFWPFNDAPSEARSKARMRDVAQGISRYYAERGRVPDSLDELLAWDGGGIDSILDGWGGPILYSVSNRTTVVLKTCEPVLPHDELRQTFTLQFNVACKEL